jgi:ribosome biogenesis protein UTP30
VASIVVDFTRVGWPERVRKVVSSSFLYPRYVTCFGIKVERMNMEDDHIVDN